MLCGLTNGVLCFVDGSDPETRNITFNRPDLTKIIPKRECNYRAAPTQLYRALEGKNFKRVMDILNDKTCEQMGDLTALRGYEQANTWIYRKDHKGFICWRVLPLHAAIILHAPYDVIELLLELSPNSPKYPDDIGMLPIHNAFRSGVKDEIIGKLITAYPEGISVKDKQGRLPHQCAKGQKLMTSIFSKMRANDLYSLRQKDFKIITETLYATLYDYINSQDSKLNIAKKTHEEEIKKLSENYEMQLSTLKGSHSATVDELQGTYKKDIMTITAKHSNEVEKLIELHTHEIYNLNQKIFVAEKERNAADKAKRDIETLLTRLKVAESEAKVVKIERDELKRKVKRLEENEKEMKLTKLERDHLVLEKDELKMKLEKMELSEKVTNKKLDDWSKRYGELQTTLRAKEDEMNRMKSSVIPNLMSCMPQCVYGGDDVELVSKDCGAAAMSSMSSTDCVMPIVCGDLREGREPEISRDIVVVP